jgi:hypothetical protein
MRLGSIWRGATDPMVLVPIPQPYQWVPRTTPHPPSATTSGLAR